LIANIRGSTGSISGLEKRPDSGATHHPAGPYTLVMPLLAQSNPIADAANVPQLPDPPLLAHYLLENPWPLAIAAVFAGIVGFVVLNRAGKLRQGGRALLAAVLLAVGVIILAALVTTEREALQERTKAMVDLTASASTTELRDYLTERARVSAFGPVPMPQGKQAVLDAVQENLGSRFPVKEHSLGAVQAVIDGPNTARTQVRVWIKFKDEGLYAGSIGSWWRMAWTRELTAGGEPGPWRVSSITVMQVDGLGVNTEAER
jgi:hypothetical protein